MDRQRSLCYFLKPDKGPIAMRRESREFRKKTPFLQRPADYRPAGWGSLAKDILALIFQYLPVQAFHRAAQVNVWWALAAVQFNEHRKISFYRDFPEVFATIQKNQHPVRDWREEYLRVTKFANYFPRQFAIKKFFLVENWEKAFDKTFIREPANEFFFPLVSGIFQEGERAFLLNKWSVQNCFWYLFRDWLIAVNPFLPDRPIERSNPKVSAKVREEIWNFFSPKKEYSSYLPALAILTHQPVEILKSVIQAVEIDYLELACAQYNVQAFAFLWSLGIKTNSVDTSTIVLACLDRAHSQGYYDFFMYLIAQFEMVLKITSPSLQIFLHKGCLPLSVVQFLVEKKKCNPNVSNENMPFLSPLIAACSQGGNLEVVEYLLEEGAQVNPEREEDYTPLMCACYSKNLEIVQLLLKNGANLNNISFEDYSALHYALMPFYGRERLALVKFLIKTQGMSVKYWDSVSSLLSATMSRPENQEADPDDLSDDKIIEYLLKKGANLFLFDFLSLNDNFNCSIKLINQAFRVILQENLPIEGEVEGYLLRLRDFYENNNNPAFSTNPFWVLCAIAIQEPIQRIKALNIPPENLFLDSEYTELLFNLCDKFHPKAKKYFLDLHNPNRLKFFSEPKRYVEENSDESAGYDNAKKGKRVYEQGFFQ